MIIIFGGTTEGRLAAETLEEAGKTFFYSTKSDLQQLTLRHGKRLIGAMTSADILKFCSDHDIRCIVDAAHPFAENLHHTISQVSQQSGIPTIRLQRPQGKPVDGAVYCKDYDEATEKMISQGVEKLLALSGANTISKLKPFWNRHDTWFRILPRGESKALAMASDFPENRLVFYDKTPSVDNEMELMRSIGCDAIITKDSGTIGGLDIKIEAAKSLNLKLFIINRPAIPENFIIVTGRHTLRRAIERIVPDFYPLRTGLTTGACATAASKAALMALLNGDEEREISFLIPDGETLSVPIAATVIGKDFAECTVIKDAGDDPDVTNGCRITVRVERQRHELGTKKEENGGISFHGGEGVGTITLPGLGIEVGEPAINPVPRKMMTEELRRLTDMPLDVTISVAGGAEIAKKTFNPKVGVTGGISIIGTSGIVRPFSNEAFIESIQREIEVAKAVGCDHIVINSGAKSEKALRKLYPNYSPQAFIHYGNFIGETLKAAKEREIQKVSLGMMIGKAVKLAEGNLDTHSHKVTMNKDFLLLLAHDCGCGAEAMETIKSITLARELWTSLTPSDSRLLFKRILTNCRTVCSSVFPENALEIFLISDEGETVRL